jgi:hypothetical protein
MSFFFGVAVGGCIGAFVAWLVNDWVIFLAVALMFWIVRSKGAKA